MKRTVPLLLILAVALMGCEEADKSTAEVEQIAPLQPNEAATADDGYVTRGTVTAVDPQAGRITIDHAAVPELEWPPMTMQFQVAERELLDDVQADDAVRFTFVEGQGGGYIIEDLVEE